MTNPDREELIAERAEPADAGMREALEQIKAVCVDNAGDTVRHDIALKFVGEVAAKALTAPGALLDQFEFRRK